MKFQKVFTNMGFVFSFILIFSAAAATASPLVTPDTLHAVLINGGGSFSANLPAYRNDLTLIYQPLITLYSYSEDNVHVLCSDGLDPAADQSDGTNSSPDLDGNGSPDIDGAATRNEVEQTFSTLANALTEDDQLLVFVVGPVSTGSDPLLNLWNGSISASEFADLLDPIQAGTIIVVWGTSAAGAFLGELSETSRVLAGACGDSETARLCDTEGDYHEFIYNWTAAVNWRFPGGETVDADSTNDGICSLQEAFDFASSRDSTIETPVIYSMPQDLGTKRSLSTPPVHEISLCHGDSVQETVTFYLLNQYNLADVVFILDITGSMQDELSVAKQKILDIMNSLDQYISDSMYALISMGDYPRHYAYCGYSDYYGYYDDYPYRLEAGLTYNRSFLAARLNSLSIMTGRDGPESYARCLYEIYSEPQLHFRNNAKTIVIVIGDNIPHDCDVDAGVPPALRTAPLWIEDNDGILHKATYRNGRLSTGIDPGRDQYAGTGDDIDFHDTLNEFISRNITLLSVHSGDFQNYWDYWAGQTGGASYLLQEASQIPQAIVDLLAQSAGYVDRVTVSAESVGTHFITDIIPDTFNSLTLPNEVTSSVSFHVPSGTACGTYYFDITARGDGALYGIQKVALSILPSECTCPSAPTVTPPPPTPTPTSTPSITPTPSVTYTPTITPTPTITQTPTITWTPTPRPTWTPTPTPSPTVTRKPTSTPVCSVTGVDLVMPAHEYHPGDPFYLKADVCNTTDDTLIGYPLVVILDYNHHYWFAPYWTEEFSYLILEYPTGITNVSVIPEFEWPATGTSGSGVIFWGALLTPSMSSIFGEYDHESFGWSD